MLTLAEHLRSAPFELILSSGFFGFYAHAGVIAALEEAGLTPSRVGGSSAGALVAGLWAAGIPALAIRDRLLSLRRDDFWDLDPLFGVGQRLPIAGPLLSRLGGRPHAERPGAGLLHGLAFAELLESTLHAAGARTFADCRFPLRVSAYDIDRGATVVLESGALQPAIRASCSFPGLFQPIRIDGARYLDGGIADRAGIKTASPGARVLYHHLPANSPWRMVMSSQNEPPAWGDLYLLTEPGLPRLGPFRMEKGHRAWELARAMTRRSLAAAARPHTA